MRFVKRATLVALERDEFGRTMKGYEVVAQEEAKKGYTCSLSREMLLAVADDWDVSYERGRKLQ